MPRDHHPVRQGGSGPLDEIDQALGGGTANAIGVLAVGGEPGGDDVRQRNIQIFLILLDQGAGRPEK